MPMKRTYVDKNRVLLVNITRLGDMLQATPTIAGMKSENPNCKITVLVEKQFEDVCHNIPNIDEVMSLDLGMTVRSLAREGDGIIDAYEYVSDFVDELRQKNFDYCLNMSSSAYTALLLKLVGISRNGGWTADEEGYRVIQSDWAKLFATSVFHQNRQFNSLNLVDVFRCSADVEQHPNHLLININDTAEESAAKLISQANFQGTGPIIALQAGASQEKRQWATEQFIKLGKILVEKLKARLILVGTNKELSIIEPIKQGINSDNVFIAAGKTSIPELSALLKKCDILITGDTGTMHMSVAVGTPVIAMFLASAFAYETGPYSEGNIILQPVIGCGPCNPNKPCAKTDCHLSIQPELVAELTRLRLERDFTELPNNFVDAKQVIVYRSYFDQHGFYNLQALTPNFTDAYSKYRDSYRKLWLDDLAGLPSQREEKGTALTVIKDSLEGIDAVRQGALEGKRLISQLVNCIQDINAPARVFSELNQRLSELDRQLEGLGFHFGYLGPLTRMFVFAKENLSGTEPLDLASQMGRVYEDLYRRCDKLESYHC